MNALTPLRRSLLYVPGDQEDMLAKAASRGADGQLIEAPHVARAHKILAAEGHS